MIAQDTTIAAISTPIGTGGISVVRLSGPQAFAIAGKVFACNYAKHNESGKNEIEPRKLYLGQFTANEFKERCLMVQFVAPNSYTGEHIVEFQCHGGVLIASGILNTLLEQGAKLAQPGEFTKRAFLNGKITLDEAEGVMDMINAESESEIRAGYNLLEGSLSKEVMFLQDRITNLLAKIEVTLDYPEVDYEEQTAKEVLEELNQISQKLSHLVFTSGTGMLIKNGTRVLILGKPNVGKSSLLNAMLNYERAIVTSVQGTTRDTIEETYVFNGVKFVLTDTAGVRESSDYVERIGIEKAKNAVKESDIVLLTLDSSEPLSLEDEQIVELAKGKKTIVLLNKSDLPQKADLSKYQFDKIMKISALNKQGMEELKQAIYQLVIDEKVLSSNVVITNARHLEVLRQAQENCKRAMKGIEQQFSLDLVSIDIQALWKTLGEITGQTNNEEIIDRIFASFCLGK